MAATRSENGVPLAGTGLGGASGGTVMNENDKPSQRAPDYYINTAPEMDALERAAADGKHGRYYSNQVHAGTRAHQIPGSTHWVQLELSSAESMAGLTTDTLEALTREQDADAALAFLYIAHLLAKPNQGTAPQMASALVSFDDVIDKIGWDPRSSDERRSMHRRIYQFLQFGERAQVIGERRGKYRDKHTGEILNTYIRSSPWRIHDEEMLDQRSLFPGDDVPVKAMLVMSQEWTKMLTSPLTAQYLPMGELLGAIPGNKPSGAWARVVGLALASFWRRLPRESLDGSVKPTRRELLERYPPKTGTVTELLASKDPRLAIDYWCGALAILVDNGFLEKSGEATLSPKEMRRRLPRQGWSEAWLDETVTLQPGSLMRAAMEGRIKAIPAALTRKRGRPRKTPVS